MNVPEKVLKRVIATSLGCCFILAAASLPAQQLPFSMEIPISGVESYCDDIPQPEDVLGHRIGDRHTESHQLIEYFRAVAEKSDRVTVHQYARSYQNRPLIYAVVTSETNHERLDEIREANRRLFDEPGSVADDELEQMPTIIFQGYTVHGDEASGSEAAVLLLYHLAAGEGPGVERVLENSVVLIDPVLNPDGRQRFANWANQNRGTTPVADPQDREHRQPWPGGRTNHYWFDPNRDWLPVRHPEGRGRLELLNKWRPQIVTDFHEMGSESHYFFQPGVPTRVHPHTPLKNQTLTAEIAEYHAEALDGLGTLYYTRETFDDFFPGKGSTYPDLTGAIGILFEQGSSRALKRETEHGLLTYPYTVRNQLATSLSTLEAAMDLREKLLRYQRDFFADASALARQSRVKAYLLGFQPDRTRAQELIGLLQKHEIRVHELAETVRAGGHRFQPGSAVIVPADQQQTRLLAAIMERRTEFDDTIFYDVSTWTLPLAFGVRSAELEEEPGPYIGPRLEAVEPDGGRLVGGKAEFAYLMPWNRYFAPRALYKLQQQDVRTRLITSPLTAHVDGRPRSFPRGTILVTLADRDPDAVSAETIHQLVERIVDEDYVEVFAVQSALTPDGPDLGSRRHVAVLEKPDIALITGSGTTAQSAGEVWHLLSERFGMQVSLLDAANVRGADLNRYNTMVLAGGSYGNLHAATVQDWVRGGGRLIGIGSGADWAVRNELVELERKEFDLDQMLKDRPYGELADARSEQRISGSIFEARLDTTHPLAFGYDRRLALFRTHATFYEPSEQPGTNVARYTGEPLLSGYVSPERLEQVPGSAAIVAVRQGQGRVVLLMDNPNFRAFWYGTNGLFLNAVFLSSAY